MTRPFRTYSLIATFGLVAAIAPAAHADLKIVSDVTVTRGDVADHYMYTTTYKGQHARLESSDGTIVLYDGAADKVYTFQPGKKTYYVQSFDEALKVGSELPKEMKDRMSVRTKVKLDEVKDGDKVQTNTVVGQTAGRYSLLATSSLSAKESSGGGGGFGGGGGRRGGGGGFPGGGGGGRRGGGGGFPGGGGGGFPGGGGGGMPPEGGGGGMARGREQSLSLGGELWAADTDKLFPTGKKDEKEMVLAIVGQLIPANSPALGNIADQLAKKHLLPLSTRLTQRPTEENQGKSVTPVVIEMKVVSLDSGTAVSDDLFRLPEGFDRVEAPTPTSAFTVGGSGGTPPPPQQ